MKSSLKCNFSVDFFGRYQRCNELLIIYYQKATMKDVNAKKVKRRVRVKAEDCHFSLSCCLCFVESMYVRG